MKILVHSNSPTAATGYGQQTGLLAPLLAEHGHDVAISAFYGIQGSVLRWAPPAGGHAFNLYGCNVHPYGDDIVLAHARNHFGGDLRAGWVVGLIDAWVFNPDQFQEAHTAWWVPIDHEPCPPRVLDFLRRSGAVPIAMSRFGERMLQEAGLEPLYAPHAVDTDVFRPIPQDEARRHVGLRETGPIVGMVAANKGTPSRKGYPQALLAFAAFLKRHPDAILYLHTEPTGALQGINIPLVAETLGIPDGAIRVCDQYRYATGAHSPEFMAHVYSAMDVLLNPSLGEGFGIPIVEAQACGTPVIVTDWTAMPELRGAGYLVEGDLTWSDQGAFWKTASVGAIEESLEHLFGLDDETRAAMRESAREFAVGYDHRRVFTEHWVPVLAELEQRMVPLPDPASLIEVA